jgi:hypothetical protein
LGTLPEEFVEYTDLLSGLFDWLFPPAVFFVENYCKVL